MFAVIVQIHHLHLFSRKIRENLSRASFAILYSHTLLFVVVNFRLHSDSRDDAFFFWWNFEEKCYNETTKLFTTLLLRNGHFIRWLFLLFLWSLLSWMRTNINLRHLWIVENQIIRVYYSVWYYRRELVKAVPRIL